MAFTDETKDVLVLYQDGSKGLRTLNIHQALLNSLTEELTSLRFLSEINLWCIGYEDFNKLDNVSSIRLEVDKLTKWKHDSEFAILPIEQEEKLLDYYKCLYSHVVKEYKKHETFYCSNLGDFTDVVNNKYVLGSRMLVSPDSNLYSRENHPSSILVEVRVFSFEAENPLAIYIHDDVSDAVSSKVRDFVKNRNLDTSGSL